MECQCNKCEKSSSVSISIKFCSGKLINNNELLAFKYPSFISYQHNILTPIILYNVNKFTTKFLKCSHFKIVTRERVELSLLRLKGKGNAMTRTQFGNESKRKSILRCWRVNHCLSDQ